MDSIINNSSAPVIEMIDVAVGCLQDPERMVLEGINWTVAPGEYWVVAGMHGSGKTDFLAVTGGLIAPLQGEYRFFGQPMPLYHDKQLHERLRLGLVFENGQLFNQLSVRENIALPLRYQRHLDWREVDRRIHEMLELTELSPFANTMPANLGRNWRKRAGLARALMLEPEVLLVDHPLGGLDLRHANWWLNFLDRWMKGESSNQKTARTLIVTAQDLRPWQERPCNFAVLKKHEFISLGKELEFKNHREPLVKELLAQEIPATEL